MRMMSAEEQLIPCKACLPMRCYRCDPKPTATDGRTGGAIMRNTWRCFLNISAMKRSPLFPKSAQAKHGGIWKPSAKPAKPGQTMAASLMKNATGWLKPFWNGANRIRARYIKQRDRISGKSQSLLREFLDDTPGKELVDFLMARNGLADFGFRMMIPVVTPAMPDNHRSQFLDFLDEVAPFHATSSLARLRILGIEPLVKS